MSEQADQEDRKALIHMLNSGKSPREATQEVGRSRAWAYKWKNRFEQEGWVGLQAHSRTPHNVPGRTSAEICQEIVRIRSELEAEAEDKDNLGYIGAAAIYGRLLLQGIGSPPAVSTIERILRQAGKTKPRVPQEEKEVVYPHLKPSAVCQQAFWRCNGFPPAQLARVGTFRLSPDG